jgi:RNA polymerase sigma-70 factor, ECF subfamily
METQLELTLIHRCQVGDKDAFTLLYDQHKNLVFRTAILILGNPIDAEDILQDVFIQVHRSLSQFDPTRASFTTWLYRITINRCLNWRRSRRSNPSLDELPESIFSGPGNPADQQAENDSVQQALTRLSQKLRVVIILRYYWEMSYAEISEILNIPLGTVKSRLNEAIRHLHDDLSDNLSSNNLSLPEVQE